LKFNELVRLLEKHGFWLDRFGKGSARYYRKTGPPTIKIDYHGSKEVPRGTLNRILKDAGIKNRGEK